MKGTLIRTLTLTLLLGAGMSSVAWGQSVNNSDRIVNGRVQNFGGARLVQTDWHWWDGDHHSDRWYREHGYYNNGNGWYRPSYRTNNGWYNPYYGSSNGWYGDHDRDERWRREHEERWRRDHDRDDRWRHDHDRDDHRHHDHD